MYYLKGNIKSLENHSKQALERSFLNTFQYVLKFNEISHKEALNAYRTLKGKRLQGSFGCLRGVTIPEKDTDELLDYDYIQHYYKYANQTGSYQKQSEQYIPAFTLAQ